VPADLEDVVMRCLARNPADRPRDGAELARELAPGEPTAATRPLPAARPGRRRRLVWAAIAGLVALAGILLAVIVTSGSGGSSQPPTVRQPSVQAIPRGASPQDEARNIAAWLQRHSGG
jgi:serine/threonine-protein kinase